MPNNSQTHESSPMAGVPVPNPAPEHDDYYRVSTEENPIEFDASRSLLEQMEEDAMDGNESALRFIKEQIYSRPEVLGVLEPGPATTEPDRAALKAEWGEVARILKERESMPQPGELAVPLEGIEITDEDVAAVIGPYLDEMERLRAKTEASSKMIE